MAPTPIEQALLELLGPAVCGHAVLIGDQRKFLSCLVAPPEGKPGAIDEAVLVKAVTEYNENFAKSRAQRIQKITSLIEPFGEQTGELTPTMKVTKRNATEPTHTNTDHSETKRRRNEMSVQIRYFKPAPSPPTSNLRSTHHPQPTTPLLLRLLRSRGRRSLRSTLVWWRACTRARRWQATRVLPSRLPQGHACLGSSVKSRQV